MLNRSHPILCLVTDRQRLCAACDDESSGTCLTAQVREAVAAGIDLVQIRERTMEGRRLAELVASAVAAARGSATRIVVNDRLDIAYACGAHGVHLRSDSIPPSAARSMLPREALVGRSVHDTAEAVRVAPDVDYLIAGTVFSTPSKRGADRLLGETGLAGLVRAVAVPVLAIGGVTVDRLPRVAAAGAAGVAAIGLFLNDGPAAPCRAGPLHEVVEAARAAFDRPRVV